VAAAAKRRKGGLESAASEQTRRGGVFLRKTRLVVESINRLLFLAEEARSSYAEKLLSAGRKLEIESSHLKSTHQEFTGLI
jgi:molybdenum-dependent DNA-binding transcriptional regulator ModE